MGLHLDHVSIGVSDLARAEPLYDAALGALGVPRVWRDAEGIGYGIRSGPGDDRHSYLTLLLSPGMGPVQGAARRHWCFRAPSRQAVALFHASALQHGGRCDGPPAERPGYHRGYYSAYVLDPDGNRLEAVCHRLPRTSPTARQPPPDQEG